MDTTNIRRFISDELISGDGSRSITDDTPLWEGIIDSIGLVELVGFLEKEYGISIHGWRCHRRELPNRCGDRTPRHREGGRHMRR